VPQDELVMTTFRYKLAEFLRTLTTDPASLLCLAVYTFAVIFVVAVVADAIIRKRKADRLRKVYQRGRL